MKELKIAALQIAPTGSLEGNLQKGLDACRNAKAMGAGIALFPEMWSNGYRIYNRPAQDWIQEAIPADGEFVEAFGRLAKELSMAIGITLLEECESGPKNTLVLFDRHGRRVLQYSKVHTCDFDVEHALTPGDGFYTADLDTEIGAVRVGAMICYDREFPESARILMLQGAELIDCKSISDTSYVLRVKRNSASNGRAMLSVGCPEVCFAECDLYDREIVGLTPENGTVEFDLKGYETKSILVKKGKKGGSNR